MSCEAVVPFLGTDQLRGKSKHRLSCSQVICINVYICDVMNICGKKKGRSLFGCAPSSVVSPYHDNLVAAVTGPGDSFVEVIERSGPGTQL